MKTLWWIIQGVVSLSSLILAYLPVVRTLIAKETEQLFGIYWVWWLLIGITVFVAAIVSVIVRLLLELRALHTQDYNRKRQLEELEIEKLKDEEMSREKPTIL